MPIPAGHDSAPVSPDLDRRLPARADLSLVRGCSYRRRWTWLIEGELGDLTDYLPVAYVVTRPLGRVVLNLEPYVTLLDDGVVVLDITPAASALLKRKCVWKLDLRQAFPDGDVIPFLAGKVDVMRSLVEP